MKRSTSKKIAFSSAFNAFVKKFSIFDNVVIYSKSTISNREAICLTCNGLRIHFSETIINELFDFCNSFGFEFSVCVDNSRPLIILVRYEN